MIRHLALLRSVAVLPVPLPGRLLHRAGLEALATGEAPLADRLFERAALAYRRELRVEALARARVHQAIARARLGGSARPEAALAVERGLTALERIEALEPPFEVTDARRLLAAWERPSETAERAAA